MIIRSVAYDLTCFMKGFDFDSDWSIFVYNSVFNGTMFQRAKFRVESDDYQVCSLCFDMFHEGFDVGQTCSVFDNIIPHLVVFFPKRG